MQSERKIHADINQARDGWIQVTLSGEGAADLTEAQIEAALSAAEPQPAPSVAVKALADAYKAGFDASSQGYNGEVFPEYEADNEWLAQRDSDLSALSAQVQDVAMVTRESAVKAIEHIDANNGRGRKQEAIAMLVAAPAKQEGKT